MDICKAVKSLHGIVTANGLVETFGSVSLERDRVKSNQLNNLSQDPKFTHPPMDSIIFKLVLFFLKLFIPAI